jgi:DNA-binding protein HU-beta
MTNSEIIKNLSLHLGKSQVEIKRLLKSSTKIITRDILDRDISITIPGLGTFSSYFKKKRKSFNPYHKKFMLLPPKRIIRFHPGSSIKNEFK